MSAVVWSLGIATLALAGIAIWILRTAAGDNFGAGLAAVACMALSVLTGGAWFVVYVVTRP